jgi:hypothetical protein
VIAVWSNGLGHIALALALAWLAVLSRRLGRVTHASPYYVGLWVAAGIVGTGVILRAITYFTLGSHEAGVAWQLIHKAIPAVGLTIGVIFAWRYWSWLFAERD